MTLRQAAEQLREATSRLLYWASNAAQSLEEFDDMTDLIVHSTNWIQGICLSVGIDIFDDEYAR
jgi:2,3-bisphosphoglycerate-independent phosphoglycerate mutase